MKNMQLERQEIPVKNSDTGLTSEEARLRIEGGWQNGLTQSATRTTREMQMIAPRINAVLSRSNSKRICC